jgi:hypothetical protein
VSAYKCARDAVVVVLVVVVAGGLIIISQSISSVWETRGIILALGERTSGRRLAFSVAWGEEASRLELRVALWLLGGFRRGRHASGERENEQLKH